MCKKCVPSNVWMVVIKVIVGFQPTLIKYEMEETFMTGKWCVINVSKEVFYFLSNTNDTLKPALK